MVKEQYHFNTKIPKELILDENWGYILGVLYGDGSISNNTIELSTIDKDFVRAFKRAIEKWTDFKIKIHLYDKKQRKRWIQSDGKDIYDVCFTSLIVVAFLKKYDINKIEKTNKKNKIAFLKGMYDSDGCSDKYQIDLYNLNKKLLLFCKKLLFDFDIKSNIGICIKKGTQNSYGLYKKNLYSLSIYRRENILKFRDIIGFNIKRKQFKLMGLKKC